MKNIEETQGPEVEWPRRKVGKVKKELKIRISKVKGEEHVNNKGRVVEKRQPGTTCRYVQKKKKIDRIPIIWFFLDVAKSVWRICLQM